MFQGQEKKNATGHGRFPYTGEASSSRSPASHRLPVRTLNAVAPFLSQKPSPAILFGARRKPPTPPQSQLHRTTSLQIKSCSSFKLVSRKWSGLERPMTVFSVAATGTKSRDLVPLWQQCNQFLLTKPQGRVLNHILLYKTLHIFPVGM